MNLNRVLLIGNLTGDPELFEAGKSKIVNASLATHQFYENGQEEKQQLTTFVDLKVWGDGRGEFCQIGAARAGGFCRGDFTTRSLGR
jgi:single-stranded DNA-binding protein